MRITVIKVILILIVTACDYQQNNINGYYLLNYSDLEIDFHPRRTEYVLYERKGLDIQSVRKVSYGTYSIKDSSIVLKSVKPASFYYLKYIDDYKLLVESLIEMEYHDTLYCLFKYHPNGHYKERCTWKNGKREGVWYFFDKKGEIIKIITYKNDKVVNEDYI